MHALDQNGVLKYKIQFPNGEEQDIARELLQRPANPEVLDLPTKTVEYQDTASLLSEEEIRCIANPQQLSQLQQRIPKCPLSALSSPICIHVLTGTNRHFTELLHSIKEESSAMHFMPIRHSSQEAMEVKMCQR